MFQEVVNKSIENNIFWIDKFSWQRNTAIELSGKMSNEITEIAVIRYGNVKTLECYGNVSNGSWKSGGHQTQYFPLTISNGTLSITNNDAVDQFFIVYR